MTRFLPDASVLVASLQVLNVHHERARSVIEDRLSNGDQLLLAAHALAETYAVLTRMPAGWRMSPSEAMRSIEASLLENGTVVALDGDQQVGLLKLAAQRGLAGGRIYDFLIAASAQAAGVDVLLTFNDRYFAGLVPGMSIVVPGSGQDQ